MSNTPLVMIALLLAWLFATASAVLLFAYLKLLLILVSRCWFK